MIKYCRMFSMIAMAAVLCCARRGSLRRKDLGASNDVAQAQFSTRPTLERRPAGLLLVVGVVIIASIVAFFWASHLVYQIEKNASGPYCVGSECNGKNPQGTNCTDDAVNLYSEPVEDARVGISGTLTLKYSENCHANWVRWEGESDAGVLNNPRVWQKDAGGPPTEIAEQFHGPSLGLDTWSGMVDAQGDTCMQIIFSEVSKREDGEEISYPSAEFCTEDLVGPTGA